MGDVIGTPGYMAPEQYLSEPLDARTDQFSFCVALYEALYGRRPFETGDAQATLDAILGVARLQPPRDSPVPPHVHRALLRGMSIAQSDRYPSMVALLDELARDPAKRWRQIGALVGSVALAALAAALWSRRAASAPVRLCSTSQAEAAEVWNPEVKAQIERSMRATGLPYAASAWTRTQAYLDDYMAQWTAMHRQTCEATRVDGHQPEPVMTARMMCLTQRREEVRALARVLSESDADTVAKAVQASLALPGVSTCKDVATLLSTAPEPADPGKRAELDALRRGLATVRAQFEAGKYALARDAAAPLVDQAKRVGYAPVTAEALLWLARAKATTGSPRDECVRLGAEAIAGADEGRDDRLRAASATWTVHWATQAGHFAEAHAWSTVAGSAVQRAGAPELLEAAWRKESCFLAVQEHKTDAAMPACARAWELASRSGNLASILDSSAMVSELYALLGRREDAERMSAEADEAAIRSLGEDHPARLVTLNDRAYVSGLYGDYAATAAYAGQAIALGEKVAPASNGLVISYVNACDARTHIGQAQAALPACERALDATRRIYGPESPMCAEAHVGMAGALLALGQTARARDEFQQTIDIYGKLGMSVLTVASALGGLGRVELAMGHPRQAVDPFHKALAVADKLELNTPSDQAAVADIRAALAQALLASGGNASP